MGIFSSKKVECKDIKILSVSQITDYIKNILNNDKNLNNIWVEGEISNFVHHHTYGHMYFSIKDESSVLRCVMFKRKNDLLDFKPEDGIKVNVLGSLDIYKKRGEYQLIIEKMVPAGKGPLFIKFQELKIKLEKEGLFREDHKKPLPKFPKKIGIATSESGDAIRDILKTIKKRFCDVTIIFSPTIVQGEEAAESIANSIKILNEYPGIDVIITGRGGGSFEDLWPFNEEIVARAIFESKVPVISAVGHEPDVCISDYVADCRAPTPTAAGQIVVPDQTDLQERIENANKRIAQHLEKTIKLKRGNLEVLISSTAFKRPFDRINNYRQNVDENLTRLHLSFSSNLTIKRKHLQNFEGKLITLNPESVLKRGYSIVLKDSKIVNSSKNVNIEDVVDVILHEGKLICKVEKKIQKEVKKVR